ncbi:peptidyl-glycine alpha-amidating monooxygenase-like [Panthera uncia]|uniref:peptidyl-glycine alpha-amidating monooxygenase-like n=1 Tax=Panthera uncia TaxID=29064 RepID=UPI0020FFAD9F|nr:peptidyl-glycine alpha-amidating monooxygenase-like [Panthera uncia]XP_049480468.1 peptidyl-glycine alpha-amidating monooxygenase-like [Panthera uncia]
MAGVLSLLALLLVFPSSCLGFRSPLSVFKRFKESTRSFSNECLGTTRPVIPIDSSDFALDVHMPGVTPKQILVAFCICLLKSHRLCFEIRRQPSPVFLNTNVYHQEEQEMEKF